MPSARRQGGPYCRRAGLTQTGNPPAHRPPCRQYHQSFERIADPSRPQGAPGRDRRFRFVRLRAPRRRLRRSTGHPLQGALQMTPPNLINGRTDDVQRIRDTGGTAKPPPRRHGQRGTSRRVRLGRPDRVSSAPTRPPDHVPKGLADWRDASLDPMTAGPAVRLAVERRRPAGGAPDLTGCASPACSRRSARSAPSARVSARRPPNLRRGNWRTP